MTISDHQVRVAEYIIDESGIADVLATAMRTSPRGRPQNPSSVRLMLIGLYLSIGNSRLATLTEAYNVLTRKIPIDTQVRLGVSVLDDTEPCGYRTVVKYSQLKYTSKTFTKALAYGRSASDVDPDERERRRRVLQDMADRTMDVFDLDFTGTVMALDATGIWSWLKSTRGKKQSIDRDVHSEVDADGVTMPPAARDSEVPDDPEEEGLCFGKGQRDPDAATGYKTAKSGESEWFFGYEEHTLVRSVGTDEAKQMEPPLIARFTVTPASTDVVEPSLMLLDSLTTPATDLLVDRHYSYKDPHRWWDELHDRAIDQHLDLRVDEQGFVEVDRLRFAAGCAHCPATPDDLGTITRPGPGTPNREAALEECSTRIELRERYVAKRMVRPERDGKHRVQCPALAGSIGCPLRPGTVQAAHEHGVPIVENPPAADSAEGLPAICTQQTVTVSPPDNTRKLIQRLYWASRKWTAMWNKRTYVEGSYGNRKNASTEALRRGLFRVTGLHWVMLVMTLVNANYNHRMLRNWHDRTGLGDPTHPLLRPEVRSHYVEMTDDEVRTHLECAAERA